MRAESRFVRSYKLRSPIRRSVKCFNQKTRRITHNSIFADLFHVLDFDKFRRHDEIQNQTVKDQRPSVSVQRSHSSQRLKQALPLSEVEGAEEKNIRQQPDPHCSGTPTYCVRQLRQTKIYTICINFLRAVAVCDSGLSSSLFSILHSQSSLRCPIARLSAEAGRRRINQEPGLSEVERVNAKSSTFLRFSCSRVPVGRVPPEARATRAWV